MENRLFEIADIRSEDDRTVNVTLSTEFPVKRFDGNEVLSHEAGAVDLTRQPLPVIVAHDNGRLPVGVIEGLKIVGRKLVGLMRISRNQDGIWNDIKDKIIRNVSVGYQIIERQAVKNGYIASKWMPYECSLVAAGADPWAGINRSLQGEKNMDRNDILKQIKKQQDETAELQRQLAELDKADNRSSGHFEVGDDHSMKFRNPGEFFLAVRNACIPGGTVDRRIATRAAGLNEGLSSEGGFLVGEDIGQIITKDLFGENTLPGRCTRATISSNANSTKLPAVAETSRATGSRWGGVQMYFAEEGADVTATKPAFRQVEVVLRKLMGIAYATDELLADSALLGRIIVEAFQDELAFTIQDCLINGTGAGQPLGILNSPCLVTADAEVGQVSATIVYENILAMWCRMPAAMRSRAVWLIGQDAETQLYKMKLDVGTGGSAVFMPGGGVSAAPYASLFGRPIIPIEHCQTLGTKGDIILADFSRYLLADKGSPDFQSSMHVRFVYDEQAFRLTYRLDGCPLLGSPITPYKSVATLSPFVALATRS